MASFLVLGDGFPAAKVAAAVAAAPGARLAAVASTRPPADGVFALPQGGSVEAGLADLLTRDEGRDWARRLGADWLLCINSTVILPAALLDGFEGRALNAHPGPLPEYGGLHAHQWAIRNGETEYGATVHRMEPRLDAGPVVASARFPLLGEDTGLSLFRKAMAASVELLSSVIARIAAREDLPSAPQDLSRLRVYRHREALDGTVDWRQPARRVVDFVRAGNYEPFDSPTFVATFEAPSGAPIRVLTAEIAGRADRRPGSFMELQERGPVIACGDGQAVRVTRARDGAGLIDAASWRRHFERAPMDVAGP